MSTDFPLDLVRPGALTALLGRLAEAPEVAPAGAWEAALRPGAWVGRFELVRELGRGGFGLVWEAHDRELGRSVAFKALRGGAGPARPDALLVAEAEAAARLAHPNIVHLYDLGKAEAGPYLIMELLRGRTLAALLAEGPLEPHDAVRVVAEIARGLAHAHRQGVVHRDLKPGNAFVCEDGQVKVLDFGLALVLGKSGVSGGTPGYMAPEQVHGEAGDARSDVYALGCILFEALVGHLPFAPAEAGLAPGAALPELPKVPATLAKLLARMLARAPGERPEDGGAALAELEAIRRAMEPRRLARLAVFVVVGLALGTGAGWLLRDPPLPQGRLLVAMADVENSTGDPDLDVVSELLRQGLDQSKRLSLMDRSRLVGLLRQAGRPVDRAISEADARLAAERTGAQLLLVPAVRTTPAGLDLSVKAVDLGRRQTLFTAVEATPGKGTVPEALDRLIAGIREQLREGPAARRATAVQLGKIVPVDPAAWRHYAEGQRLDSEGRGQEAIESYRRAIAVDPNFPLPHIELAFIFQFDDDRATASHVEAAMRHLDRVTPRERGLVEALEAAVRFDFNREMELFDRLIAEWPEWVEGYRRAGAIVAIQMGERARARPYLEKLLAFGALGPGEAVSTLLALGRLDEALERAKRWAEQEPGATSLGALSHVHRRRGEASQALEAADRAVEAGAPSPWFLWAYLEADAIDELRTSVAKAKRLKPVLLAMLGQRRAALQAHEARKPSPTTPFYEQAMFENTRGEILTGNGDLQGVRRQVQILLALGSPTTSCFPLTLAWLGDVEGADRLDSLWPMIDGRTACRRIYRTLRAWRTGDHAAALRLLDGFSWGPSDFYRGEILLDAGRPREAVEAFVAYRREPASFDGEWFATFAYPRSLYLEAVARERLDEREEARRLVARLFHLWAEADQDLPTLAEAKVLQARLGR
jgi:eukaryotic-like serine/threonine-protein kinase